MSQATLTKATAVAVDKDLPLLYSHQIRGLGVKPRFGIDAEYFLVKDGQVVPADNYLNPQFDATVLHRETWGWTLGDPPTAIYYDGIQGEFSTSPSTCRAYVMDAVQRAFRALDLLSKEQGLTVSTDATVKITAETLEQAHDKLMSGFGCAPSKLRRAGGRSQRIDIDGDKHLQRYAGLHLHLGRLPDEINTSEGKLELVRWMDVFVGLFGVFYENDLDRERRKIYGKAGEYREKPYGLEYRTPSPQLFRHPALLNQAMALARMAVAVAQHKVLQPYFALPEAEVIAAIDNVDRELAKKLYKKIRTNLEIWGNWYEHDFSSLSLSLVDFIIENGPESFFTGNLYDSWRLDRSDPVHGNLTPTFSEIRYWLPYKDVQGVDPNGVKEFKQFLKKGD